MRRLGFLGLVGLVALLTTVASMSGAEETQTGYVYGPDGRLSEVHVGDATTSYQFDAAGNLLSQVTLIPEPASWLVQLSALLSLGFVARRRRRGLHSPRARRTARGARLRRLLPATLVLLVFSAAGAGAHTIFPTQVKFRQIGETSTVDVVDCCGCSAIVGATVDNTSVATVSPSMGSGTAVQFVVTAQTDAVSTAGLNITVQGFGTGEFGQSCTEDSLSVLSVTVKGNPNTFAQLKVSGKTGDPVSTLTGELFDSPPPDLVIPGSRALYFQRYYASSLVGDANFSSALGNNWLHNYDIRIVDDGTFVDVFLEQGRIARFKLVNPSGVGVGDYELQTPTDIAYTLAKSGTFTFRDPSRNQVYAFQPDGRLASLSDDAGVQTNLTHSGGLLTLVSQGTRQLTFAYSGGKLTSVTADGGRSVGFSYTGNNLTSFTDVRGGVTTYAYDAADPSKALLVAVTLPESNVPWTQVWDGSARVGTQTDSDAHVSSLAYGSPTTTLTDPLTHTVGHVHDTDGRLVEIVDEASQSSTFAYDADDRLTGITDRLGNVLAYTYHAASGRVASVTNPDGGVGQFAYTARGNLYDLTGVTYPDGLTESVVYDAKGNPTQRTNRAGDVSSATYDASSQVLTQTNPEGGVTTLTWNPNRTLATFDDPSGNTTAFAYDGNRNPNLLTFDDATMQAFLYDAAGNITRSTDERGYDTDLAYDDNGNLQSITNPLAETGTFGYDGQDRLTVVTNPLGNSRSFGYDERGHQTSRTDEAGNTRSVAYDERGRISTITTGSGDFFSRTYTLEGTLASETDPLGNTTNFTSDSMGRFTAVESRRGFTTAFAYDAMGRLITRTDPTGEEMSVVYDALNAPVQLSQASVQVDFTRNKLSQITSVTDANGEAWDTPRDAHGRILASTDPLGNTETYAYDVRNRVTMVTFPGGLGSVTRARDEAGNVTQALYSDATDLEYVYDAAGRLVSGTLFSFGYDAAGQLVDSNGLTLTRTLTGQIESIEMAPGKVVFYAYDARDLVTSITDWDGNVTTLAYDGAGHLLTETRPNGVVTTYTYDADGEIATVAHGVLGSIVLTRDEVGRITAATRNLPVAPSTGPPDAAHTFDAASQVVGYSYDEMGRRTADDDRTYTFDLASRLTSYDTGGSIVSFGYDALGMRVSRTSLGTTEDYVWNHAFNVPSISVVREAAIDQRYYVHLPNGQLLYSLLAADDAPAYYHYDEVGNTLFLTDSLGSITDTYAYSVFGEELAVSGSGANPFRYLGQYGVMREAPSLYYVRARYYDSAAASFLSRDPVRSRLPHRVNPYQYASGSPLQWIDPVGTDGAPPPNWANRNGAVGLGPDVQVNGTNGRFRQVFDTQVGLPSISPSEGPPPFLSSNTGDSSVASNNFNAGPDRAYKLAYWQRGSLSRIFGDDVQPISPEVDVFGTDGPFRDLTTPLPENLPAPLQEILRKKRLRIAGLTQASRSPGQGSPQDAGDLLLGLGLQGEFFPTQYLSLFAQAGIQIDFIGEDDGSLVPIEADPEVVSLTSQLEGNAGFTVWFR